MCNPHVLGANEWYDTADEAYLRDGAVCGVGWENYPPKSISVLLIIIILTTSYVTYYC